MVRTFSSLYGEAHLQLWQETMTTLLQHLPSPPHQICVAVYPWSAQLLAIAKGEGSEPRATRQRPEGLTAAVLELAVELYTEVANARVQAALYAMLLGRLLLAMCSRHEACNPGEGTSSIVWKTATKALIAIAKTGALALVEGDGGLQRDQKQEVWLCLCQGLHAFLLPPLKAGVDAGARLEEAQENEQLDMRLIDLIVFELLPLAPSDTVQAALLRIVSDTSTTLLHSPLAPSSAFGEIEGATSYHTQTRLRFYLVEHCLGALFELAALGMPKSDVAAGGGQAKGGGGRSLSSGGWFAAAVGWGGVSEEADVEAEQAGPLDALPRERGVAIAKEAAPALVCACNSILAQYVRDEAEAATYPLPRARTEQVSLFLSCPRALALFARALFLSYVQ